MDNFLGMVRNGQFQLLKPQSGGSTVQLTTIAMQEARSPESGLIDLTSYEGLALFVEGRGDSDWIYSARITDTAGPILSTVVEKVYGAGK